MKAGLLSLVAREHVVTGENRTRVWRLFDGLVNVQGVDVLCENRDHATLTVRATSERDWMVAVRSRAVAPVTKATIKISPDGTTSIATGPGG